MVILSPSIPFTCSAFWLTTNVRAPFFRASSAKSLPSHLFPSIAKKIEFFSAFSEWYTGFPAVLYTGPSTESSSAELSKSVSCILPPVGCSDMHHIIFYLSYTYTLVPCFTFVPAAGYCATTTKSSPAPSGFAYSRLHPPIMPAASLYSFPMTSGTTV